MTAAKQAQHRAEDAAEASESANTRLKENLEDEIEHWDMGGVGEGPEGSGGGKEPLEHPEIVDYFSSWSPFDGRYCLGEELRKDFPED